MQTVGKSVRNALCVIIFGVRYLGSSRAIVLITTHTVPKFSESPTYARTLLFKIAGHGRSNSLRRAGNQPTTDKVKREGDETDRHDEDLKLQNGSLGSAIADLYCAASQPSLVQNKGSRQGIMGKHVRKHRFPRVAGYRYINLSGYVDLLQKTVDIVAS
ncbi:uncharacterized protein MCYG_03526 [Microsporum canis CBS 113480]|uniref:Uncharacterized protein n=1 Tax=Arthroderma otae (strain ATCC MYA-4605 / CBS 113480) TaxID=554155 RepID=C5FLY5_ARTOC|nr:uncharacterized protein MCYG_03526 [Microsporum canis CBS 113480]EEQ30707.1 predicted protein [Microsporum canis CBS 113480]